MRSPSQVKLEDTRNIGEGGRSGSHQRPKKTAMDIRSENVSKYYFYHHPSCELRVLLDRSRKGAKPVNTSS